MGTVDADINAVEVVEKREGLAIDDFIVALPEGTPPDVLVTACTGVAEVQLLWLSYYPESWGLHADIDLLDEMTADPRRAAATLTHAVPQAFHATWAVLVDRDSRKVVEASELAPDLTPHALDAFGALTEPGSRELPADWLPGLADTLVAIAPLRDSTSIVVGRHGGPEFMTSEVARLRHLAALAG